LARKVVGFVVFIATLLEYFCAFDHNRNGLSSIAGHHGLPFGFQGNERLVYVRLNIVVDLQIGNPLHVLNRLSRRQLLVRINEIESFTELLPLNFKDTGSVTFPLFLADGDHLIDG